jgi:hypothetical protein
MRSWVFAKLMWDPSLDVFDLMQDFIWGHFGNAAPCIAQYNELLMNQGKKYQNELVQPEDGIRYRMDHPFLSREFLDQAASIYDQAENLAENETILARIQQDRLPIMYVKLVRGPEFVGPMYGPLLEKFEKIARAVNVTHLREGSSDLDEKLDIWRKAWQDYQNQQP